MTYKMSSNCRKRMLTLNFMLFCLASFSQYNFSEVDKKIAEAQKNLSKNLVVLIYKDGKIVYKKESGEFKMTSQEPIASCSKWLTAALVMTFVDQGKISLDDKVSTYLPIFAKYGKGYITLRHCLSHMTGIQQEPVKLMTLFERRKYATLEDEVNDFASKKEIDFNPGSGFFYGGVGLDLAARVIEVVAKRQFEQLMQERIMRPLNMRSTSFFSDRAVNPSGGAISAAIDYLNFLTMILNKGTFNGKTILSEKAIAEMQKPQTSLEMIKYAPKAAEGFNYGLGEWIQEVDANGNSTVVCCPGLFGTWPMVDKCRGYACIFFMKGSLGEEKKDIYLDIKRSIDAVIPSNCK